MRVKPPAGRDHPATLMVRGDTLCLLRTRTRTRALARNACPGEGRVVCPIEYPGWSCPGPGVIILGFLVSLLLAGALFDALARRGPR